MVDFKSPDFLQLIERSQQGDKEAYRQFLNALYPWIEGRVGRRVFNESECADVVQDVMISVHKSLNTFDSSYSFLPWLLAICNRRIVDYIRKKGRIEEQEISGELDVTNVEGSANIDSVREQYELLAPLPENLLRPVWLTKIEGFSTAEAAEKLGIKENALRTRLSRAFKMIEKYLEEE